MMFYCKKIRVLKTNTGWHLNAQDFTNKCKQILQWDGTLSDKDREQILKNVDDFLEGSGFNINDNIIWHYPYEEVLQMLCVVGTGGMQHYFIKVFTPALLEKIGNVNGKGECYCV